MIPQENGPGRLGEGQRKWYYMDSNGVMRTNSLIDDTYYVNSSGEMVLNEWRELSDNWIMKAAGDTSEQRKGL